MLWTKHYLAFRTAAGTTLTKHACVTHMIQSSKRMTKLTDLALGGQRTAPGSHGRPFDLGICWQWELPGLLGVQTASPSTQMNNIATS